MMTVKALLKEQISNQNSVFVFPTDIAAKKWADWVVKNTSVKAVAMERFFAWDNFKGEYIRSAVEGLKTVPSLMRKIFSAKLIEKNAEEPFFKNIIAKEYASNASSFSDWISSLLSALHLWKKLRDKKDVEIQFDESDDEHFKQFYRDYKKSGFTDAEDSDFEKIHDEYSAFLQKNSLFDPAWVEPNFSGDSREYFLIYPETLDDWEQYKHKLSKVKNVHFISVPESEGEYESYFFENSAGCGAFSQKAARRRKNRMVADGGECSEP